MKGVYVKEQTTGYETPTLGVKDLCSIFSLLWDS